MKRHTAILLAALLCILALSSCSPIEYPEALERKAVTEGPTIYVTPYAKKAEISFTPVRNADSYTIRLEDDEISVPLKVKDGLYTFFLRNLTPETNYDISITASNTEGNAISGHSFKTTEDSGELDYSPLAYMSARNGESVTVTIHQMPNIQYRVSIEINGLLTTQEIPAIDKHAASLDKKVLIEGLSSENAYSIKVEHRKANDAYYSNDYTELVVPIFRPSFQNEYTLKMNGSVITVMDALGENPATTEKKNITLLFYPDGRGIPEIMETKNVVPGENLSFDVKRLGILRSGLFDVVLTDQDGNNPLYSEPSYFTTPVVPVIDQDKSNQKSIAMTWIQPEDMEEIVYTISGESLPYDDEGNTWKIKPSEVELDGSKATLVLEDLVSNTEYNLKIDATLPNEEKSSTVFNFKTDSFAGVYRWVCPTPDAVVPSFVIEVWDYQTAKDKGWEENWNMAYPYHVFVHESDPSYDKSMDGIAIMPLFRGKDTIPTSFISYAENDTHFKKAYHWNEMKWNATGTIHPSAWLPDTARDVHGPDTRTSYTLSKALGTLTTKTDFTFRVKDGKPQIVFRNAGDGKGAGTVNIGLFKNPQPEPGTDKFTFILNRIGSVE